MAAKKDSGNLRDFRIDRRLAEDPPRQSASSRDRSFALDKLSTSTAGIDEWDEMSSSNLDPSQNQNLWKNWEQEIKRDVAPKPLEKLASEKLRHPQEAPDSAGELASEPVVNIPWSADLALIERRAERQGVVDVSNAFHRQELLKQKTLEFTGLLQKTFREHIEIFNDSRKSAAQNIQLYKISKTAEDFMLFRNGVKLICSGQRAGKLTFAFNQYMQQIFSPNQRPNIEIEASWGVFDELHWTYKGERVQLLDIVRYFLSDFVRQSFK